MVDATPDATVPTDETASEPPPTSRNGSGLRLARNIAIGGLIAVTAGVGILYGPTTWRVFQQRDTTIGTPPEVAGLRLDDSDSARETAEYVRDAIDTSLSLDKTVGVVYDDPQADNRSIIFAGGTGMIWKPADALEDMFALITDDTGGVKDVRDVKAGPLGGEMRCGATSTPEGDLTVCGWADHGSAAVALFANRAGDESAKVLLDLRKGVQKRG